MTDEARVYRCPTCGGPTPEFARRCDFCLAPVATVRCESCLHMNTAEALHCAGCGEQLSPSAVPLASEGTCPECRLPMVLVAVGERKILDCSRCGGQFIAHNHLRSLLERREAMSRSLPGRTKPLNPMQQKVVYRPCPSCKALMHRRNFGGASGIIVDICGAHGTFFDAGELPNVLAFVARGGLERARQAEREAERQRASVVLNKPYLPEEAPPIEFGAAAEALLNFVVELIDRARPSKKRRS